MGDKDIPEIALNMDIAESLAHVVNRMIAAEFQFMGYDNPPRLPTRAIHHVLVALWQRGVDLSPLEREVAS